MVNSVSRGGRWRQLVTGVAAVGLVAGISVADAQTGSTQGAAPNSEKKNDETVLITGANRGLGLEFARQYAEAGWNVIATARRPEAATELSELDVQVLRLDVADQKSIESLVGDLDGVAIDLLINNAGIFPRSNTLEETDFDDALRTYEVNTIGPMRVTRALLPNLRAATGKKVVSITSGLGSIESNTSGRYYGYRESKAALNMFTRSLAVELRDDGFICVVISPGWVRTDMGGPNANLAPEESVSGMRAVIAGLTREATGTYWNYNGETLPW